MFIHLAPANHHRYSLLLINTISLDVAILVNTFVAELPNITYTAISPHKVLTYTDILKDVCGSEKLKAKSDMTEGVLFTR